MWCLMGMIKGASFPLGRYTEVQMYFHIMHFVFALLEMYFDPFIIAAEQSPFSSASNPLECLAGGVNFDCLQEYYIIPSFQIILI